ncbi:MAG: class I SAM-dependent methyltransferase [Candidatus Izemoplasmatales bacterium]|nr:class I SAM-dependent methyltransferase [Candidatus Izemoplasmatales bacterium]
MKCVICANECAPLINPKTEEQFWHCPDCDTYVKESQYYLSPVEEKKVYLRHHNSFEQKDYVAYLEDFVERGVLPYSKPSRLLEYGCGATPVLSKILESKYHYQVTKYDKYFFPQTKYLTQKFDVITSTEVIEHIEDPDALFREWSTLLKPGGILAVMTLFHPKNHDSFFAWWYIRDLSHIRFFTKKTFEMLAEKYQLSILYCDEKRIIVFQKAR